MKVQFRWGFWALSWDFSAVEVSTLGFCLSPKSYSWTNLNFMRWLLVLYGFLKPLVWFSFLLGRFSSFRCISNCCFYGEKMYLYIIKCIKRKNNAIFKGKQEKQSQAHSHFQLLLQKSQVQENHRGEWNPLVEGTVNSIEQKSYGFVPITSKNTPSLQYMHLLKMRDKADTCFVLIHHRRPGFCCFAVLL